ncbi:siderophore-interacting protein [Arsenicicoccus dermatophilus]|uniref:siderophore-interacting protein n=1 Tax=Arsenicicoccus dermatophilus TaxID=1076331 RepID=UPI001F4CE14E|nr:siderophore-interacting protein [Arsenicicoccus dermatophilus]MCH8614322.1 siderophore-interacting protein [Arsenicicoccus dermatophilus]
MIAPYRLHDVEVSAVREVSPHLRRVTVTGALLDRVAPRTLDRRIKLVLPRRAGDDLRDLPRGCDWWAGWRAMTDPPPVRTYTVRQVRPQRREVDVEMVLHDGAGPAGSWAATAAPGDRLAVALPQAHHPDAHDVGIAWRPGTATEILLAGDETALPAIANIVAELPESTTGQVYVEVPTSADRPGLRAPAGVTVHEVARDGRPHGTALLTAVRDTGQPAPPPQPGPRRRSRLDPPVPPGPDELLWEEPEPGPGSHYAWLAGESSVVRELRTHLLGERGWPRQRVAFMGYWRRGRVHP